MSNPKRDKTSLFRSTSAVKNEFHDLIRKYPTPTRVFWADPTRTEKQGDLRRLYEIEFSFLIRDLETAPPYKVQSLMSEIHSLIERVKQTTP